MELYKDSDFTSISTKTILDTYNEVTGKKIKKFATRTKGIERLREVLPDSPPKGRKGRKVVPFNYPFALDRYKAPREVSFRGRVVAMLTKRPGKPLDDVVALHKEVHTEKGKTLWEEDHYKSEARALIQFLHYDHGYGVKEDTKGNIRVFVDKEQIAAEKG